MRRTKIVATLGPASSDSATLDALIGAGVDVFRLNAAHSGPGELAGLVTEIRRGAAAAEREVGILLDLPGPKVRIGDVEDGVVLEEGASFVLLAEECVGDAAHACVTYRDLAEDVSPRDRVLLDDGRIELEVVRAAPGRVETRVATGGPLFSNKGVNVPGVRLSVESITRYDRTLLAWAMANDIDWIGQSFVRTRRDVEALREHMTVRVIPIVAKIEKHEAVSELEEIVSAADAVMVARGDLAVETSPEAVPVLQRRIIAAARAAGKPVVVATEMLDSMRVRPRPTRAEASDVANAIFNRADAVMLSGETAVGEFPLESVQTMGRIIDAAEAALPSARPPGDLGQHDVQQAMSAAAVELAADLGLAAIVPATQSGATALAVSRYRPVTPIVAATPRDRIARRLALVWGVRTVVTSFPLETRDVLEAVVACVREAGYAQPGDRIALTAGLDARTPGGTDFLHVRTV